MASILDEINAEVELELSQQPKEEKPKSVLQEVEQEVAAEPPTEEPKSDFFESAEKWLEPAPTQKTNGDIFLNLISNKRAGEINNEDKEFFNALGDEDQYKVAQARKDIPLDDAQARRIFEVEKSKMPSVPTSWEDWYNLGGDAFDVVKNVVKLGVKVPLGAAEFGRDVVKATDMTVSDEEAANNIKKAKGSFYSFMAPAFEIPESVAWATQKASEGGFGWADAAGEKLGLVNPEDRFERWKGRRLVSQAQAEYFREHPTVYSRMLDNPLAKDALSYIAKSQMESPEELAARNNISVEEAKAQQDAMAREQIDNLTSDMESELPEENNRVRIAGEFLLPGELGMGTMGAVSAVAKAGTGVAKGLKYIGKSADEIAEINKAAQALRKSQFAEMLKKRTERAEAVAQGAGKIEKAIEGWKPAAEKVNKVFGNITAPVLGGVAGYSVSQESPTTGILTGILGGAATRGLLKGTKVGLEIPTFVREVAEARKVAPLGKTFETLGKSAEGSALKAKILSRGGKTIDNILSNSVEYAKTGIHGTTLALATGALESADPEEMKQMLADGLAITLGGRALQHIKGKMMGNDPIIEQRERISDDSRIHRRYQEADPETQANLDQISDFDNAISARQTKLNESESDLANLMAAYKGSAEDAQKIKLAQSEVEKNKIALDHVKRANVQTRNEFGREFLKTYANLQDSTNGVLRTGQNNVGYNILTTDQIYQRLRNNPTNKNVPDSDLIEMASQAGFYSNPTQEGVVFDSKKPSIVINADSIRDRVKLFGESPIEALTHEDSHFRNLVPEFQSALAPVRSMLFQNEIRDAVGNIKATTPGLFSKAKLVELFNDGYLRHLDPQGKEAFTKLNKLWDESRGQLDENKVAEYMKSELMSDLLGEVSSRHLGKDLDSATLAMWDRARIKAKKTFLDRAIDRFYGFGGRGDIVTAANTRAEFPPEAMAAARDAMRQIVALNAEISPPAQQADMPAISKAQMMKNSALLNRFGKDSPLFKSEFKVKVFDKDGNQIGESLPVTTPNPREGTFQSTDAGFKKLSGYGDIPVEAQGMQVPEGGTLVVARDLIMQPDGVTPIMYEGEEAKKANASRKKLIIEALDTDDYGTPNRFEPVSDESETHRGTFTPLQIQAIKDMPESLVPRTLKEHMLKVNEAIARGDGTRFIADYAAVMNDKGKYQAFSPKMYDFVPIGMHLSGKGNFLVTAISVGRIFEKMRLWNERMPGRLNLWDNNTERAFDDFVKYLNNWQRGEKGETGLDADPIIAAKKKNVLADLLNIAKEDYNPDRTKVPKRKGDPRNKEMDRIISSFRIDHIAELLANENATKLPVNYGFAKINFMPERMEGEVPMQEKRQIDENVKFANPPSEKSAIDALSSNKREYFGMHRGLDDGYPVGIRIDIPAFTSKGVYVVTVHEKKKGGERGQVGERIGYDTIAKVDNPIFFSNEVGAKKIKSGEANKFPVATVEGQFNSSREIPEDINEWTPVGYNPREHSYFYDKTNDEPVLSGDEAISVGNTVFVKNPVYGDKANFAFMPERPIEERFPTPERGFYSGLQQTIDQKVQGKFASPDQLKAIISNPQNVKAEELKWSGVLNEIDRLSVENQGKVPKDKVMDYLRNEGAVEFEEATLGENTEANKIAQKFGIEIQKEYEETTFVDKDGDEMDFEDLPKALQNALSKNTPPKYEKYQLPNGENYREVVMTMPNKIVEEEANLKKQIFELNKRQSQFEQQSPEWNEIQKQLRGLINRQSDLVRIPSSEREGYTSSHFPEVPNYVAHMRLNERTDAEGNKGLFIEELQSDRHQAGREKGYEVKEEPFKPAEIKQREDGKWGFWKDGTWVSTWFGDSQEAAVKRQQETYRAVPPPEKIKTGIPDAPFRKDWGVQLFKRALRDAVESGKSWIGWTTGDTQAERYDLSKQIGKVVWNEDTKMLTAYDPSQNRTVIQESNITSDKLSDYVGKEVAQKLVDKSPDEDMDREISGLDLKIGGEGMKGFYDQILPKEIGKYVSKMGGKVEKSEIDQSEAQYKVNRDSQPLPYRLEFSDSPEVLARFATANEAWAEAEKRSQTPIWKVNITPEMAGKVKGGQLQFMPQRPVGEKPQSSQMIGADTIKPADIETSAKPATDAVIKPYSNALVSSAGLINFLPAYHGTPYDVDKFKLANIGTGEGAQAYGWGLYFAQARSIGERYRKELSGYDELTIVTDKGKKKGQQLDDLDMEAAKYLESGARDAGQFKHNTVYYAKQAAERSGRKDVIERLDEYGRDARVTYEKNLGNLYKVDIDVKDEDLLDWDKPLSEQSEKVKAILKQAALNLANNDSFFDRDLQALEVARVGKGKPLTGSDVYADIQEALESRDSKAASEYLLSLGIPGIRYLDGISRLNPKTLEEAKARVRIAQRDLDSNPSNAILSKILKDEQNRLAILEKEQQKNTYNYVVFDENLIKILDKNDKPVEGDLPKQAPLAKGENFEVSKSGDVFVDDVTKPIKFTKDIGLQFMPSRPEVNLEDYIDKPIIALTADRMGVGKAYVGPKGAEQEVSQESQGGPGFSFLYTDEKSNPVWGFTRKEDADRFVGRITSLAKKEKSDSVLVAPTLLSPDNHLHNPTGQLGYAEAINAAIKANLLDAKLADSHIEQIMQRVAAGKGMPQADKDKFSAIKSLADFTNAVKAKEINFRQAAVIREKAAAKTLPISVDDMTRMGILPSEVAKNLSQEGFYELPTFSVVSLFEVPANQKPEKGGYYYSYPWIVRGNAIGFLKNIYNLDKLTSAENVRSKKTGELSAQPVMVVMPQLDPQKIQEASNVLQNLKKPK